MTSGLLTQPLSVLKPRKIRFLRIIADGEYNPFRSTSVNLIRKPKCFFNLTYPSGSMLLWYEREHVLLFPMQDMAFQRLIRHVENSELQSFLARLIETAERKALHQMLGQSFKKDLVNLESLVNLAALLSGFMAAWKIWLAKT